MTRVLRLPSLNTFCRVSSFQMLLGLLFGLIDSYVFCVPKNRFNLMYCSCQALADGLFFQFADLLEVPCNLPQILILCVIFVGVNLAAGACQVLQLQAAGRSYTESCCTLSKPS